MPLIRQGSNFFSLQHFIAPALGLMPCLLLCYNMNALGIYFVSFSNGWIERLIHFIRQNDETEIEISLKLIQRGM